MIFEKPVRIDAAKQKISGRLNYTLWKWSDFIREPTENILLGDSRMANFDTEVIKELKGMDFKNMAYGGGTVPELIETFRFCQKKIKLKKVIIGVNFSLFNEYNSLNRCLETKRIFGNRIFYFINKSVIKSSFILLKDRITKNTTEIERPNIDKEKFWQEQIKQTARKYYEKYKYPESYFADLQEISDYCEENNIELVFIIFPIHSDLQDRIHEFERTSDLAQFKKDIGSLGKVHDFHLQNEKNSDKANFKDPFHYTNEYMMELINDVFQQ